MTAKTDYLENALLDHVLRATAYTSPTALYLALFTSATDDAGGGTEVSGGSYARQAVTFDAAASGQTQNTALVTFPTATANWGTITHMAIYDAVSGGNMLYHGELANSKTINTGQVARFQAGTVQITEA